MENLKVFAIVMVCYIAVAIILFIYFKIMGYPDFWEVALTGLAAIIAAIIVAFIIMLLIMPIINWIIEL